MTHDVRIESINKTLILKTNSGVEKFEVRIFKDVEPAEDTLETTVFRVQVFTLPLTEDPDVDNLVYAEKFYDSNEAEKDFHKQIYNYSIVVQAESKRIDDISVYAKKIGYKIIDPDCCANCEYSIPSNNHHCGPCHSPCDKTLLCGNEDNFTIYEGVMYPYQCYSCPTDARVHPPCHHEMRPVPHFIDGRPAANFCGEFPPRHPERKFDIKPKVSPNGHCNRYSRRK